ncbi:cytochrome P450 [Roridomyces roridus]|uniref:Cytochrome P450 n=1 Tax=Roridomyces roridus TaxID=1738132 RepID=A0AAD7BID8_9AGAR|nr:cytochrome P450 [Roridomyces roridus]
MSLLNPSTVLSACGEILLPIVLTFLFYILFHGARILYHELTSPLRNLVGPGSPSLLTGNFTELIADFETTENWRKMYGPTFQFRGLFSISELHTSDIKAITHVMTNSAIYGKAPFAMENSRQLMGDGIVSANAHDHGRFRRILNPAFSASQMRVLTETFVQKSIQLRDIWAEKIRQDSTGETQIEAMTWLRLMTLEIIGKAGFNYDFNTLTGTEDSKPNELDGVLKQIFMSPSSKWYETLRNARSLIPILRFLPLPGSRLYVSARSKMQEIGSGILALSKAALNASETEEKPFDFAGKRDILSVLLKANLSPDVPENQRLTDTELISQIPTFFIGGHETTSSAAAWALHALSVHQDVQKKLRQELLTISTDNPTMDEINSLAYLERSNIVVRETLRVYSPIVFRHRTATKDDVLPLSKPCLDRDGRLHDSLLVPKGQTIFIPIHAINTDPELWGPDAKEWKPSRWSSLPSTVTAIPTIWANLLTFFAGPNNCIGFRFAVLELKVVLFTVIRAFEVSPGVSEERVGRTVVPQRPVVRGEAGGKSVVALPLILKAYEDI